MGLRGAQSCTRRGFAPPPDRLLIALRECRLPRLGAVTPPRGCGRVNGNGSQFVCLFVSSFFSKIRLGSPIVGSPHPPSHHPCSFDLARRVVYTFIHTCRLVRALFDQLIVDRDVKPIHWASSLTLYPFYAIFFLSASATPSTAPVAVARWPFDSSGQ